MTALYFTTLAIAVILYLFIDKKLSMFHVAIMILCLLALNTSGFYTYYLILNYLVIFAVILYLSGFSTIKIIVGELIYMLWLWYWNVPSIFEQTTFTFSEHIDIKFNFEMEICFVATYLMIKNKLPNLNRSLLLLHIIMYGATTCPWFGYKEYLMIRENWIVQQQIAIAYNLWWILAGLLRVSKWRHKLRL